MAATNRTAPDHSAAVSAIADACRDATVMHVVVRADGDALAAAGILASACRTIGTPYHVSPVRTRDALVSQCDATDSTTSLIVIGADTDDILSLSGTEPVSPLAFEAALELDATPDPVHALVGTVAAGAVPSETAPTALERADLDRHPGVATPTADVVDGLAHTTLAHADFSGDPVAAQSALEPLDLPADRDEDADRQVASLLAISVAGHPGATTRAGTMIERALRPYSLAGPFATVGGYADVLCALAATTPSLGIALALGVDVRAAALAGWRKHATAAHTGVRSADTTRHDGVYVARTDGPVETVARLLRDFRSPEPVVVVIGDGDAGIASVEEPIDAAVHAASSAVDGSYLARETRAYARFDPAHEAAFVAAFRKAL